MERIKPGSVRRGEGRDIGAKMGEWGGDLGGMRKVKEGLRDR